MFEHSSVWWSGADLFSRLGECEGASVIHRKVCHEDPVDLITERSGLGLLVIVASPFPERCYVVIGKIHFVAEIHTTESAHITHKSCCTLSEAKQRENIEWKVNCALRVSIDNLLTKFKLQHVSTF